MELTKHAHACVTFDNAGGHLLVDPGTFSPNAAELVAGANTILITHEHFDHLDEVAITAALEARPELRVYGPSAVVGRWRDRVGQEHGSGRLPCRPNAGIFDQPQCTLLGIALTCRGQRATEGFLGHDAPLQGLASK